MEPAEALQVVENVLRLAIRNALGDAWVPTSMDVERLRQKQTEDRARRDGVLVSDDLLSYVEYHDLVKIVMSRWESFKPIFDDKKRTEVLLDIVADVRNAIAHSRALVAHERDLVSGVAGMLQNQVAIYRTEREPASAHYPLIESVSDSFGRQRPTPYDPSAPGTRLELGQIVDFACRASDPRGRDLEWELGTYPGDPFNQPLPVRDSATGVSVVLRWTVDEADIGEYIAVFVQLRAAGARYRRRNNAFGGVDDVAVFNYAVNPPAD